MKVQLPTFSFCDTLQNAYYPVVCYLSYLFPYGLCHDLSCCRNFYPYYIGRSSVWKVCRNAGYDRDGYFYPDAIDRCYG